MACLNVNQASNSFDGPWRRGFKDPVDMGLPGDRSFKQNATPNHLFTAMAEPRDC